MPRFSRLRWGYVVQVSPNCGCGFKLLRGVGLDNPGSGRMFSPQELVAEITTEDVRSRWTVEAESSIPATPAQDFKYLDETRPTQIGVRYELRYEFSRRRGSRKTRWRHTINRSK